VALYINGLPAPELTLTRGVAYTVVVETGGADDDPLYITSNAEGGYGLKDDLTRSVSLFLTP